MNISWNILYKAAGGKPHVLCKDRLGKISLSLKKKKNTLKIDWLGSLGEKKISVTTCRDLFVAIGLSYFKDQRMLIYPAAAAATSLESCATLCDPIDGSPPGSPVPGILQARTLEWVAISFSNAWKWKVKVKSLSRVRLLATPWTAAHQAPPSMGFSGQEHWSGVPLPSPYMP